MKNLFLFLLVSQLSILLTKAQNSGKGFSYQAVARALDGQIKASTNIELQFSLLPGANALNPTWQEKHVTTTDEYGICNLIVGKGIKSGGTVTKYADIDYSSAEYWLKVELKDNGIFQEIHKMQLLSVPYAEVSNKTDGVPIGSIIAFAADTGKIPEGFILCNGRELNRTDFAALYKIIGNSWGSGNGTSTFQIPNFSGMFLRGIDYEGTRDEDRLTRQSLYIGGNTGVNVGSFQNESIIKHTHPFSVNHAPPLTFSEGSQPPRTRDTGGLLATTATNAGGGNETRPDNVYVNYIIKFK